MKRIEHLLTILSEECNETGQRASKALRFGIQEIQPGGHQTLTNAERIRGEFAHVLGVYEMLTTEGGLTFPTALEIEAKKIRIEKYLHRSRECGTLE